MIKGSFATRSEIKELVEKITREKIKEIVGRTKGYYEAEKDLDEKMGREMDEDIEQILESMKTDDGPEL